uniref:Uncharacterized protein n=1 Tax=Anguilla anguilla TaxID=7936 RepID=A0A0E9P9D5_ANGAN
MSLRNSWSTEEIELMSSSKKQCNLYQTTAGLRVH